MASLAILIAWAVAAAAPVDLSIFPFRLEHHVHHASRILSPSEFEFTCIHRGQFFSGCITTEDSCNKALKEDDVRTVCTLHRAQCSQLMTWIFLTTYTTAVCFLVTSGGPRRGERTESDSLTRLCRPLSITWSHIASQSGAGRVPEPDFRSDGR